MKKILLVLTLLLSFSAFAKNVHVKSLQDYNSINPSEKFKVEVIEDAIYEDFNLLTGDILNCTLVKIKPPKRGKIDAKMFFNLDNYERNNNLNEIEEDLIARYSPRKIKETIKEIEPKNAIRKTAGVVGNFFVQGFSYGLSFVSGVKNNQEDNRIKSGFKQVYDDSFLSYVEQGEEVEIKKGDVFYLVVKKMSKKDLEKQLEQIEKIEQEEFED